MHCRKDFMELSTVERVRLATALNALWDQGRYQIYGPAHEDGWFSIHRGPEFLPWHRWYILRLEQELRSIDARVTLPYWNWARAGSQDLDVEPWKSFFGGRNNTGGQFDHWDYNRRDNDGGNELPSYATLVGELDTATYAAFRNMERGSHVPGHTWTGGTMASPRSPCDPLFFLHHCNIDRLWAVWQLNNLGAAQYTQDASGADHPDYTGSKDGPNDVMFAGALGGGATPAAMLDHRALGYRYPEDTPLATEWEESEVSVLVSGDATTVSLQTTAVTFNDVPEGDTTMRSVHFKVDGCKRLLFEVTSGPTGPFTLDDSGPFWFPQGDFHTEDLRVWLVYTGEAANTNSNGLISIRVRDAESGDEIDRWDDIPISANSIARPTAAVVLVLDESGSMLANAGNNRTRLENLQIAATTFIDQLYDDNGISLISFDETAERLEPLAEAGDFLSGVRSAARTAIANHGPPDEFPHTSIGAGIQRATQEYSDSPLTGDYDVKAMVVFTDGIEDREPWIRDVEATIPDRVYAVGVGAAGHVDSNKLREIANGTGGYMLHQGAVEEDDEFLLEKFFIQILAGVLNRDIINDPPGVAVPGEIDSVPFSLNRADVEFDAVILNRFPNHLTAGFRTPNDTIVGPHQLPPGSVLGGATSLTLRVALPLVVDGVEHWEGPWELLLTPWRRDKRVVTTHVPTASTLVGSALAIPYHAVVHARSSLNLRASLTQTGFTPGSDLLLTANLTEYGQSLPTHPAVHAELTAPGGVASIVNFTEATTGTFEATVPTTAQGIYRFRVIASGTSRRGRPFTREQLLTGVVGQSTRNPDGTPPSSGGGDGGGGRPELCKLLECFFSDEVLTERARKRLEELGIDVERLRECLAKCCGDERKLQVQVARLLGGPRSIKALREMLLK